jgi:hypothetical protein
VINTNLPNLLAMVKFNKFESVRGNIKEKNKMGGRLIFGQTRKMKIR